MNPNLLLTQMLNLRQCPLSDEAINFARVWSPFRQPWELKVKGSLCLSDDKKILTSSPDLVPLWAEYLIHMLDGKASLEVLTAMSQSGAYQRSLLHRSCMVLPSAGWLLQLLSV